jgi:transposase
MDLRDGAVQFVLAGESRHAVAGRLGLGGSRVMPWLDRYQKTGPAAASKIGGSVKPKIAGSHGDGPSERSGRGKFTLHGLTFELADHGLKVDDKTMGKCVHVQDLSFKKNRVRRRTTQA